VGVGPFPHLRLLPITAALATGGVSLVVVSGTRLGFTGAEWTAVVLAGLPGLALPFLLPAHFRSTQRGVLVACGMAALVAYFEPSGDPATTLAVALFTSAHFLTITLLGVLEVAARNRRTRRLVADAERSGLTGPILATYLGGVGVARLELAAAWSSLARAYKRARRREPAAATELRDAARAIDQYLEGCRALRRPELEFLTELGLAGVRAMEAQRDAILRVADLVADGKKPDLRKELLPAYRNAIAESREYAHVLSVLVRRLGIEPPDWLHQTRRRLLLAL